MMDEDDTMMIRMKKDFRSFMPSNTVCSSTKESAKSFQVGPAKQLDFDESYVSYNESPSRLDPAVTSATDIALQEQRKENRLQQADLLTARGHISLLESKLSSAELKRKRARIEHDTEIHEKILQQQKEQQQHQKWRRQCETLELRTTELERTLREAEKALELRNAPAEKQLRHLEAEKKELVANHEQMRQSLNSELSQLQKQMLSQQMALQSIQSQLNEKSQQLAIVTRKCDELEVQNRQMEKCRAEAVITGQKLKDLQAEISRQEADAILVSAMKSDLVALKETRNENKRLSDENASLREKADNILLLREQLKDVTGKLARSEEKMADYQQTQIRCQELEIQLKSWNSAAVTSQELTPQKVKSMIGELQESNVLFLEKQGELQSRLNQCEESLRETRDKLSVEEEKTTGQADLIKRLQRKLLFTTKERDGFENILKSYEGEVTMEVATVTRLQQLQTNLAEYRRVNAELEAKLHSEFQSRLSQKAVQPHSQEHKASTQQKPVAVQPSDVVDQKIMVSLREQIAKLQGELDQVKEEKESLKERMDNRLVQGEYDPRTTKVLHLRANPASIRQHERASELARLRSDNERLIQRVRLLEDAQGGSTVSDLADLTVVVEQRINEGTSGREIQDLRSQLETASLRAQRLVEVFQKTSADFRKACYKLLGYQVDLPAVNQYRLRSIYAQSDHDYLLFQKTSEGDIQLLETDFSQKLGDKIETYLTGADSIPAFLSSITLATFNAT